MECTLLAGTDLNVSGICYGTSGFHGLSIQEDMDRTFAIFRDAGGNFFDTAHVYRGWDTRGSIEVAIGEYFRRNGLPQRADFRPAPGGVYLGEDQWPAIQQLILIKMFPTP